jgi:hypothetical protein
MRYVLCPLAYVLTEPIKRAVDGSAHQLAETSKLWHTRINRTIDLMKKGPKKEP